MFAGIFYLFKLKEKIEIENLPQTNVKKNMFE